MAAQKRNRKPKRMSAQVAVDEEDQLRCEVVAGLDLAEDCAVVCVPMPPAQGKKQRRSQLHPVPAAVPAITELAALLKAQGVQMVAMEAASGYWRAWFAVLEEAGLQVQLVNSSRARNLPGRPKTDKEDARWTARLTETGMLRPSFVPPPQTRALRVHTRLVFDLTADRTRCWQRLEKLLEDALCKLSPAVSKLAGCVTARSVTEAMTAGERDPGALAALGRGKMSIQRLDAPGDSLAGMQFGPQHAHAAASLLRQIDLPEQEIQAAEDAVTAHLASVPAAWGADAGGAAGPDAGRDQDAAVLPAAGRLDEIPGTGRQPAAALIAGTGLDMSRFPTPEALVSRAGLTPAARQSGPRKGRGKKGHGNTCAKRVCVPAACAAANTGTFPGERFRRLASRPGGGGRKKAGCAVGRSVLVIVWHLLNDPAARYRDPGPDWHARHTGRNRKVRNAQRQLEALGFDVVITLREDAA